MGAAGEFIAVAHPVAVGIATQAVAGAVEAFLGKEARPIIAQGEEVEVAGGRMGASRGWMQVPSLRVASRS